MKTKFERGISPVFTVWLNCGNEGFFCRVTFKLNRSTSHVAYPCGNGSKIQNSPAYGVDAFRSENGN